MKQNISTSPKTVLFLIPALRAGGMERVMSELLRYFSSMPNLRVHLLLYGKKHTPFYPIPEVVIVHQHQMAYNTHIRFLYTIRTLCYLRKEIKKIKPDTLLSFGELWNSLVLVATLNLKMRVYVSDRCQPDKSFGRFHDFLRRWLYPKASGIIVQTELAKNIYKDKFGLINIIAIPNPIRDIISIHSPKRENIVISVGRLIDTKHFDRLIQLFARINDPQWMLIIVGGDALNQRVHSKLKELIAKLNISEKVLLTGELKDVDSLLLKSKIFAFTSSSEGFPNVIGEAMSAGLPVIAYDCVAGPSEMVTDSEDGFLIPLFDDTLFEAKLRLLMEDDAKKVEMGEKAKKSIQKFNANDIFCQFYQYIMPQP